MEPLEYFFIILISHLNYIDYRLLSLCAKFGYLFLGPWFASKLILGCSKYLIWISYKLVPASVPTVKVKKKKQHFQSVTLQLSFISTIESTQFIFFPATKIYPQWYNFSPWDILFVVSVFLSKSVPVLQYKFKHSHQSWVTAKIKIIYIQELTSHNVPFNYRAAFYFHNLGKMLRVS